MERRVPSWGSDLLKWEWKLQPGDSIFNLKSQGVNCPLGEKSEKVNSERLSGGGGREEGSLPNVSGFKGTFHPQSLLSGHQRHQWPLSLSSREQQIEKNCFVSQMSFVSVIPECAQAVQGCCVRTQVMFYSRQGSDCLFLFCFVSLCVFCVFFF